MYNFNNNIECNDANTLSGDGCSSSCLIEKYYTCIRKNSSTPDKCIKIAPLIMNLTMTKSAMIFFFYFKRLILNYTFTKESINFTQIIDIEVGTLNKSEYVYKIEIVNPQRLKTSFEFQTSFNPIKIKIMINHPEIFRDENNVSLRGFIESMNFLNMTPIILNEELPLYIRSSLDYQKNLEKISENSKIIVYSLILSSIPFFWLNIIQFLWIMLDSLQITNFFLYFNLILPENAKTILGFLTEANLYFLSNFINTHLGLNQSLTFDSKIYPLIKYPEKFEDLGISSLFLINAGSLILIILLLYLLYGLLQMAIFYEKTKNVDSKIWHHKIIIKLEKTYSHPSVIRLQSIFFFRICLATCLQFRSFSTLNTEYFYHYILAFFSFIYLSIYLFKIFKISNNEKTFFHDETYLKYYEPIFQKSNMNEFIRRNSFFIINV